MTTDQKPIIIYVTRIIVIQVMGPLQTDTVEAARPPNVLHWQYKTLHNVPFTLASSNVKSLLLRPV